MTGQVNLLIDDDDLLGLFQPVEIKSAYPSHRRWERTKIHLRIQATFRVNGVQEVLPGQANDIGEGGLAVYLPADLTVGDKLAIELVLPYGQRPVTFESRICNRNGFRYGLAFEGIQDEERDSLVRTIADIGSRPTTRQ